MTPNIDWQARAEELDMLVNSMRAGREAAEQRCAEQAVVITSVSNEHKCYSGGAFDGLCRICGQGYPCETVRTLMNGKAILARALANAKAEALDECARRIRYIADPGTVDDIMDQAAEYRKAGAA